MESEVRILGPDDLPWDLLARAEALQARVWGFADRGPCYPARLYRVQAQIGGTPLLAVAGGECVGFLLGLAAYDDRGPYVWSQVLGVEPAWQGRGVAAALKWRQREVALGRGVDRVEWTFDPLEARNARFNLGRLAARGVGYERDLYGGAGGPRYALPADRLRVVWRLAAPEVAAAAEGRPAARDAAGALEVLACRREAPVPEPGEPILERGDEYLLVRIPGSIQELLAAEDRGADLEPAARYPAGLAWRLGVRAALEHYLARGWRVAGTRAAEGKVWLVLALEE